MINSVIIPLIKNKCGDHTDKNNYRPIALSSIIAKGFEHIIAERLEVYLWTNDNQFGPIQSGGAFKAPPPPSDFLPSRI